MAVREKKLKYNQLKTLSYFTVLVSPSAQIKRYLACQFYCGQQREDLVSRHLTMEKAVIIFDTSITETLTRLAMPLGEINIHGVYLTPAFTINNIKFTVRHVH
jgi:hypothetical protein